MFRLGLVVTVVATLGACTRWSVDEPTSTAGPRREVARRLVGAPMVEERTHTSVGGVAGGTSDGNSAAGGLAASHASVKRTHCVQQAQIDYAQDIELTAQTTGRGIDLGISIPVTALGLLVASTAYSQQQDFDRGLTTDRPADPTASYITGGAMAVAGGAWLIYSLAVLPKGPRPTIAPTKKEWTETTYVEAEGCGLVPGDPVAPRVAPPAP